MRKWTMVLLAASLLLLLTGCGSKSANREVTVSLKNMLFNPKTIEVKAGTTVIFKNDDAIDHSVVEGDGERIGEYTPLFKSADYSSGDSWSYTFDKEGTYQIFCNTESHWLLGMVGKVVVK